MQSSMPYMRDRRIDMPSSVSRRNYRCHLSESGSMHRKPRSLRVSNSVETTLRMRMPDVIRMQHAQRTGAMSWHSVEASGSSIAVLEHATRYVQERVHGALNTASCSL